MAEIIDFFSKKPRHPESLDNVLDGFSEAPWPTPRLALLPRVLSPKDFDVVQHLDLRYEWDNTCRTLQRYGIEIESLEDHAVTLGEVGDAVVVAAVVYGDVEAEVYFEHLLQQMLVDRALHVPLKAVPCLFRGYVFTLNYQVIQVARTLAR